MSNEQNHTENEIEDNRPDFLKDAVYQGDLYKAPYALSVSSPKIEPVDKRMLKANAHEAMQLCYMVTLPRAQARCGRLNAVHWTPM